MANSSGITSWLVENAYSLGIRIESATWTSSLLPGICDISLKFEYQGRLILGSGAAREEDTALSKAIAEAMERAVFIEKNFPSSNGMAAHSTPELAANAAIQELRERDLFLCHFFTKRPFPRLKFNLNKFPEIEGWSQRTGIIFSLYKLGKSGIVCLADGRNSIRPFGFVISAALKGSKSDSIESSIITSARWAHRIFTESFKHEAISLDEFENIKNPSLLDHGRLARNIDYANKISYLFEDNSEQNVDDPAFSVKIDFFRPSSPKLSSCPIFIARATSGLNQNLFAGHSTRENINLDRLRIFSKKPIKWEDLNPLPHPFN